MPAELTKEEWKLIEIEVAPNAEEAISSLLFELGTTGIVTLAETDTSVRLGAYFAHNTRNIELMAQIQNRCADSGLAGSLRGLEESVVQQEDWMQKWKEGFEPIEIGERLVVGPSWKLANDYGSRKVVRIDPGMAFGTGTHETTRLCLESIEKYWTGGALLNVGTGTGILAIAAALLHPGGRVVAVDVDPLAVTIARENARANGAADLIQIAVGEPRNLQGQLFDVVVANLTAEVIIGAMQYLVSLLNRDGIIILSGILNTLANDVWDALGSQDFHLEGRQSAGEWTALVARRALTERG